MDYFTTLFASVTDTSVSTIDILFVIFGTFILGSFIGWIYKETYKWKRYTQGYVQTLIVMAVIMSIIMLIVGSNIARAFTMMGALSVIRFRNNIKETRDIGFIFFAMVVGMAMGVELYLLAVIGTVFISAIFFIMNRFDWFSQAEKTVQALSFHALADSDYQNILDKILGKYHAVGILTNIETHEWDHGDTLELTYRIESKTPLSGPEFVASLREEGKNKKIVFTIDS